MNDPIKPNLTRQGGKILVVEDDPDSQFFFKALLESNSYEPTTCSWGEEALELLAEGNQFELMLLDLILPGISGWEVLKSVKIDPKHRFMPVIVMSAVQEKAAILEALDLGAEDFLTKPVDLDTMLSRIRVMLRIRHLYEELSAQTFNTQKAQRSLEVHRYLASFMGSSTQVQELANTLENVVNHDTTVLMEGESGTGKSCLAETVHKFSKRREGPFIVVNCSAYPETLLATELFGHEKGAFTGAVQRRKGRFEMAQGGTILLDEVGDISPLTQVTLLRVIQDRCFERIGGGETLHADVRIIAATNRPLKELMEQNKFREDLYYRLNVVRIELPPLRRRLDDLPFLANHFLQQQKARLSKKIYGFSHKVLSKFMTYPWPGNVRELENVVEHAVLMCRGEQIQLEHLPKRMTESLELSERVTDYSLFGQERALIQRTLEQVNWNKYRAAQILGISRSTLYGKINRCRIKPPNQN